MNRFKNKNATNFLLIKLFHFLVIALTLSSAASPPISTNIIFEEIGKMASSMTYIHVGIPLNISTFSHQINLLDNYIQGFTNLTTDQPQHILFTKTIRDLATFADSRLQKLGKKVLSIDHLLPAETTGRQKRLIFAIPYGLCSNDLHLAKVDRNNWKADATNLRKLHRNLRDKLKDTQDELYACKNPTYPDFPEFHATFKNSTYPFSSTPPPTTTPFSAFRPTRQTRSVDPIYDFLNSKTLSPTQTMQKQILTTLYPANGKLNRQKRQLLIAAGIFAGVLGTFIGLYNTHEIHQIQKQVLEMAEQHNLLTHIVQRHEHQIQELAADLKHLTEIVRLLVTYNPALVYAKLEENVKIVEDRLDVLFDTLQQLQHQRLSVKLLDDTQLQILHSAVANTAQSRNLQVLATKPQDYFQLDVSYVRSGNDVLMLLHVPCITTNHMLTLYKYIPFPFPVSHESFSDNPHPPIFTIADVLSRKSDSKSALYFLPETDIIAVGRQSSISNLLPYKLVTQSELASCQKRNKYFLCEKHQVLRKDMAGSCLGSLYLQHEGGVIQNCKIEHRSLHEEVYQLNANEHLIFTPTPITTQIICNNGSHYPIQLIGTTKIFVPDYCAIETVNYTITSDGNVRISPEPLQMKMILNMNLFPSDMLNSIRHVDDEFNRIKISIDRIQNDTMTDAQFDKILYTKITSVSTLSIILWTTLGLTILGLSCLGCWYLNSCRRDQARLRQIRRRNKEAEAGTPLVPLHPTAPPKYDEDEDEITFLARTTDAPTTTTSCWGSSRR